MNINNIMRSNNMDCKEEHIDKATPISPCVLSRVLKSDDVNPSLIASSMNNAMTNKQIETIRKVLSNCYWNVVERLQILHPSRCARDINYCYQHHYNALLPNAPTFGQAKHLRGALMNQLYKNFIDIAVMMCTSSSFPGDGVLTKIIEIILVLLPKNLNVKQFQMIYIEAIHLFRLIVCAFPPCWFALRPYYVNLFDVPIVNKGKKKTKLTSEPTKIVPLLLKLLENIITESDKDELSMQTNLHDVVEDAFKENECNKNSGVDDINTMASPEILNSYDWGDNNICLDNFYLLSTSHRLSRIFDVLELLLCIIESDCAMWLLHHHKRIRKSIFVYDECPLIVLVCELKEQERSTTIVNQLFKLYAIGSAKGLHKKRLTIIERYIALVFELSNTADLEFRGSCYRYPSLTERTKKLIHQFFLTFKSYNPSNINNYVQAITLISQPYVRYQFIDHFLQMFQFSKTEELTPKKIIYDLIHRKTWRKYKPRNVISQSNVDDISREDYLDLLLNAMRAYCKWHGCDLVLSNTLYNREIKSLQTVTESPHRQRQRGVHRLILQRIEDDLPKINHDLKLESLLSMPKVDLPIMDIKVDSEILKQYQIDLKCLLILAEQLPKEVAVHSQAYFSSWLDFLTQFRQGGNEI